jgi:hypothetical protein
MLMTRLSQVSPIAMDDMTAFLRNIFPFKDKGVDCSMFALPKKKIFTLKLLAQSFSAYIRFFLPLMIASILLMGCYMSLLRLQPLFQQWVGDASVQLKPYTNISYHLSSEQVNALISQFPFMVLLKSFFAAIFFQIIGMLLISSMLCITVQCVFQEKNSLREVAILLKKRLVPLLLFAVIGNFIWMLSFSLMVLPGLYLAPILLVAIPLLLFDDHSVWRSTKEAFSLMRGSWWFSFVVMALPLFLVVFADTFFAHIGFSSMESLSVRAFILYSFLLPIYAMIIIHLTVQLKVRRALRHVKKDQESTSSFDEGLNVG